MTIETIVPDSMRRAYDLGHYAPAAKANGFIFLSGVIGRGATVEEEFRNAWETVGAVLAESGAGFADIVDSTLYIVDIAAHAAAMAAVKDEFIHAPYPPSTWIGVTALIRPAAHAEIKVVARVPGA
jgi:enamine deaminase RidA (YjgF/YER057c/UK114 family)